MLTDSLPKNATSSLERPSRLRDALGPVAPDRPAWRGYCVSAREAHGKPQLVRKPSDWIASSRASLVQHGPTKTVFEIIARRDLSPDDILTLEDFRARLVHRGEGTTIDADLEVLCGEAVLMALLLLGLAWPVAVNPNR